MSRSPGWLVILLYEHLLSHLRKAKVQMGNRDIEGKGASLEKASSIVVELLATLNTEKGGEVATRLAALYAYFADEILRISLRSDMGSLDKLIAMVSDLHESWMTIVKEQLVSTADSLYEMRKA